MSKVCAVIPTYRNASTVVDVVRRTLGYLSDVFVVCDGCVDGTAGLLEESGLPVKLISYPKNRGKGHALKTGFREALRCGFDYALTIDSDGQHYPEDIPAMLSALRECPGALVVGCRDLRSDNMPSGNTFANRFSNFWFRLQTGCALRDTQSGFRIYPLAKLPPLWLVPPRYEAELEMLVLMSWKGLAPVQVPVRVLYQAPGERVSSFRPGRDFARISALNTVLCLLAVTYGYPRKLISLLGR